MSSMFGAILVSRGECGAGAISDIGAAGTGSRSVIAGLWCLDFLCHPLCLLVCEVLFQSLIQGILLASAVLS